jgi:uncharacterized repeat protein (TIGR02543 family)
VVSEVVHVRANLLSAKTYTLTVADLNIVYTITYHLEEGQTETGSYRWMDGMVTLTTPSREGYAFMDWYENAGFTGGMLTQFSAISRENKQFYARWMPTTPLQAVLTWLTNGNAEEDGVYAITVKADESIVRIRFLTAARR